jgi:hypothetical protein
MTSNPQPLDTVATLLLSALMALLGPLLGQVVLIVVASFLGALIALTRAQTERFWPDGLMVLSRGMGLALVVGGAGSALWLRAFGDGSYAETLALVSAVIGLRTDWALERLGGVMDRFGGKQ